jgi:hypothetical protein
MLFAFYYNHIFFISHAMFILASALLCQSRPEKGISDDDGTASQCRSDFAEPGQPAFPSWLIESCLEELSPVTSLLKILFQFASFLFLSSPPTLSVTLSSLFPA